jgi:hypothetical protein
MSGDYNKSPLETMLERERDATRDLLQRVLAALRNMGIDVTDVLRRASMEEKNHEDMDQTT